MNDKINFRRQVLLIVLLIPTIGMAQTTEFTYQGKLVDGASPANAVYDFEFRLFSTETGGAAIATHSHLGVQVANGVFTVKLDFGGQFDGNARWLEIAVKPAGGPNPFTVLTPRQPITSTPYSIRSLTTVKADVATNSLQLGGVNASQYVLTTDSRMTDARNPLPSSTSYIQNSAAQQASSSFNISGSGTAGGTLSADAINATTQYNIGDSRILSNGGTANLFSGVGAGAANSTGQSNSFFGFRAGFSNTTGGNNAFFGSSSGAASTTGNQNAFFGDFAGVSNTTGSRSAFFGYRAGQQNTTADDNSFFGYRAGFANTTGFENAYFGNSTGSANTTGFHNAFFGYSAGIANTTADNNSFFGWRAGFANTTGFFNAFFGSNAGSSNVSGDENSFFGFNAGKSNTGNYNSFLGSAAGLHTTTGEENSFFGLSAGVNNTTGSKNSFFGSRAGFQTTTGDENSYFGQTAGTSNKTGSNNTIIGANADVGSSNLSFATALGACAVVSNSNTIVLGRSGGEDDVRVPGALAVVQLGSPGLTDVCRNASNFLSTCSSSLRYKTGMQTFFGGLDIVRRLRPITFNWKDGGTRDVGFGAEEVEQVEQLLVTYNTKGEIEGVKYGQLTTVLVNAVREQQTQIEQQQKQLQQQQQAIDDLRKLVCRQTPTAEVCKERR